jgi:hypothetical protein
MSCQTPVIRRGSEAQRRARGTPSRRQVTHVSYDPSFEMPDEGGPNERLTGDSIPRRVTPSRVQLAVSMPARSPLFYSRGSSALRSVPRVTSAPTFGDPSQLSACPTEALVAGLRPPELLRHQMRLEYGLEAQRLLPYRCQEWSEAHRFNSKLYWLGHSCSEPIRLA